MASTPGESLNVLHGCDFTNAMAYQRALECGGQLEFYWDRTGFHTGAEQFIKAITTTAEYRFQYQVDQYACAARISLWRIHRCEWRIF
jgi:hypothetical protein